MAGHDASTCGTFMHVVGTCENVGYLDNWHNLLVVREGLEMF